jgi:hypothetical protein
VPLLTQGQEEAIILIHEFEGDQFDNLNFAGSALAFHRELTRISRLHTQ